MSEVGLHMTDIIGSVHLNQESIRIIELERFLGSTRKLQIELRQPGANCIGVKVLNPEVKVIDGSGLIVALLNTEEGFPYTQDMCRCRLLPKRHAKELLIELGRAVKVGNLHGDMVHTDSREPRRRRWSCERARGCQRASGQGSDGNSELAASQLAALQVSYHSFYRFNHRFSLCAMPTSTVHYKPLFTRVRPSGRPTWPASRRRS